MKWVPGVLIFVMLSVIGCSSVQKSPVPVQSDVLSAQGGHITSEAVESESPPTHPDVMYHVFSAEVLGAEGDFHGAAAQYLEAALISEDSSIAERAARVAVSAGDWQMVTLASDRWAMLDPQNLDARELAAGSRLREGDYVGAQYQLAEILNLTAGDRSHGWRVVTALLAPAKDQVRANKVMDKLLETFDGESDVDALLARSQFAARNGHLDEAYELIKKAITLEPDRPELLSWAGRLAASIGYETLALKHYKRAWSLNHAEPQIAVAYAELLKRSKDLKTAQAVLAQAPDTPDMRFARILFALDAGQREKAESLYRGFSVEQYKDISTFAFQAAQSAELLVLKREAIDWYKRVTGERSVGAALRQALLLAGLGDVSDARKLLKQLRAQANKDTRSKSYQAEAQILQDISHKEEALQLLGDALVDLPEEMSVRYARALLAVELNQLALAESDLRQIISAQPGNVAAINALGYTLADRTDRFEEAERLIKQAYQLKPEDASIIDSMGWISYRLGRLIEAEKYLREAWKTMRNAEIAAHLGEVLWAQGQKDEARSLWDLGLKLGDDNGTLTETLQRLGEQP